MSFNSLYSLTWGDYGTSLISAVQLLRIHGDLVDCTLSAGGRNFPAHKIVLGSASPLLLDLLKSTPCKHPVVLLAGVQASDLEALLEFVYRGEVSVDHSQLPSLLQAAHCLNIQGLAPQTVTHKDEYTSIQLHPSLLQHQVKIDVGNNQCGEEIITINQSESNDNMENEQQHHLIEEITEEEPIEVSSDIKEEELHQFLPSRKRKVRTKKTNAKLLKTEENSTQTQNVIESTENGITIKTEKICPTIAKSEESLKSKAKSLSEQPAHCPICNALIRQSRNLKRHLELKHFGRTNCKKGKKSLTSPQSVETASTSTATPVAVTIANQTQLEQTIVNVNEQQQPTHVVTQQGNTDGSTSLSIAHVQTLQGHQLIGNLNQATLLRTDDSTLESGAIIGTHEPTLRPHTELYRVYTLESRPEQTRLS